MVSFSVGGSGRLERKKGRNLVFEGKKSGGKVEVVRGVTPKHRASTWGSDRRLLIQWGY